MIILNLKGGIGNQIIQISFATTIISINNLYYIDSTNLFINEKRKNYFNKILLKKLSINIYIIKILSKFSNKILIIDDNNINEYNLKLINDKNKVIVLDGYFQNINFNSNFSWLRLNRINVKDYFNINDDCSIVAIHVRRGDYLSKKNLDIYHILDLNYYNKAIKLFKKNFINVKFIIFSDDHLYIKDKFIGREFIHFNNTQNDYYDFTFMSSCDHFITANSTYSYCAALLGSSNNSIKIGPSKWFNDNTAPNLYDNRWLLI